MKYNKKVLSSIAIPIICMGLVGCDLNDNELKEQSVKQKENITQKSIDISKLLDDKTTKYKEELNSFKDKNYKEKLNLDKLEVKDSDVYKERLSKLDSKQQIELLNKINELNKTVILANEKVNNLRNKHSSNSNIDKIAKNLNLNKYKEKQKTLDSYITKLKKQLSNASSKAENLKNNIKEKTKNNKGGLNNNIKHLSENFAQTINQDINNIHKILNR